MLLHHNPRVVLHVGRRTDALRKVDQFVLTPNGLQQTLLAQILGNSQQVNGLTAREQTRNGSKNVLVCLGVEGFRLEQVNGSAEGFTVYEHGPQYCFLQI